MVTRRTTGSCIKLTHPEVMTRMMCLQKEETAQHREWGVLGALERLCAAHHLDMEQIDECLVVSYRPSVPNGSDPCLDCC